MTTSTTISKTTSIPASAPASTQADPARQLASPLLKLPEAIAGYIAGANAHDTQAAAAWFTPDAVVKDEGRDRRGLAAITAWKEEVTQKYQPLTQPLGAETTGDKTVVTARVSGNFPGSPVDLKYAFTLEGGKIARLEIVA